MNVNNHTPEIYLLEKYVSLEYFGELCDTWALMVDHLENCLHVYMQNLPKNYRSHPVPEQPDVVWGGRVLPNFRDTLQGLRQGFILLKHGDFKGLSFAHGPRSDFKGQMDYWSGWMARADENLYGEYLNKCVEMAHNIVLTEGAYWDMLPLSNYDSVFVPIAKPPQWPAYRINKSVAVESGKKTGKSGFYLSSELHTCVQFLSIHHASAPLARVLVGYEDLFHPTTGEKYDEQPVFNERACVWYLIERAGEAEVVLEQEDEHQSCRVLSGNNCPKTGYYFTPARLNSRRAFNEGEIMPDVESSYGIAIWQWDSDQT